MPILNSGPRSLIHVWSFVYLRSDGIMTMPPVAESDDSGLDCHRLEGDSLLIDGACSARTSPGTSCASAETPAAQAAVLPLEWTTRPKGAGGPSSSRTTWQPGGGLYRDSARLAVSNTQSHRHWSCRGRGASHPTEGPPRSALTRGTAATSEGGSPVGALHTHSQSGRLSVTLPHRAGLQGPPWFTHAVERAFRRVGEPGRASPADVAALREGGSAPHNQPVEV